jgi:hypothetical protein
MQDETAHDLELLAYKLNALNPAGAARGKPVTAERIRMWYTTRRRSEHPTERKHARVPQQPQQPPPPLVPGAH